MPDPSPAPAAAADDDTLAAALAAALDRADPESLDLQFTDAKTVEQTARDCGLSESAVRAISAKFRARLAARILADPTPDSRLLAIARRAISTL
jgi:hypothetical protein